MSKKDKKEVSKSNRASSEGKSPLSGEVEVRTKDLDLDKFDLKYDDDKGILTGSTELLTKLTFQIPFKIHIIYQE